MEILGVFLLIFVIVNHFLGRAHEINVVVLILFVTYLIGLPGQDALTHTHKHTYNGNSNKNGIGCPPISSYKDLDENFTNNMAMRQKDGFFQTTYWKTHKRREFEIEGFNKSYDCK